MCLEYVLVFNIWIQYTLRKIPGYMIMTSAGHLSTQMISRESWLDSCARREFFRQVMSSKNICRLDKTLAFFA